MTDRNNDILLGELIADSKSSKAQRALLFDKLDQTNKMIVDLTGVVQSSIVANESRLTTAEKTIMENSKDIGSLKVWKNRAMIGIAAIGGVGGITGAVITGITTKLGLN
jgi:hypothetical protein